MQPNGVNSYERLDAVFCVLNFWSLKNSALRSKLLRLDAATSCAAVKQTTTAASGRRFTAVAADDR